MDSSLGIAGLAGSNAVREPADLSRRPDVEAGVGERGRDSLDPRRAASRSAVQRFAAAITALLDRGRADGEPRADLDTEAAAWWLLSLVSSQRFRQATAGDPRVVETRLADSTSAYLTGR